MSSAHAFVCDGYDGEGLFHFNWGWDGKADGYFAIDFLNPLEENEPWITGYNSGQSALLNIRPRSPEIPERALMPYGQIHIISILQQDLMTMKSIRSIPATNSR